MEKDIWYIPHTIVTLLIPTTSDVVKVENILMELNREKKIEICKIGTYNMYKMNS